MSAWWLDALFFGVFFGVGVIVFAWKAWTDGE